MTAMECRALRQLRPFSDARDCPLLHGLTGSNGYESSHRKRELILPARRPPRALMELVLGFIVSAVEPLTSCQQGHSFPLYVHELYDEARGRL